MKTIGYIKTLSGLICFFVFFLSKITSATNYVDYGSSNTYSLASGDSLYIASGTYTGNINGFATGAKIAVSEDATFQPTGLSWPNVHGTIYVYGTFIMNNSVFRTNSSFTIYNYGIVQINYETKINGSNQYWYNSYGGIMNFIGDVQMNGLSGDDNNRLVNFETVNFYGDFQMNAGSKMINHKNINGTGDLKVNGGTFINEGKFENTGQIDLNNGASVIRNYCKLITSGGIHNSSGNLYNHSYIWAKNDLGTGVIEVSNAGNIINEAVGISFPIIHASDLDLSGGSITGFGYLYFYGYTKNTGGITGDTAASTPDTLRIYEVTRTNPPDIYDLQNGTVAPSVLYSAWGVPDSTREYITGCSVDILIGVLPLNIDWNYFTVSQPAELPELFWAGEFEPGTIFQIQRSYDGISFNEITRVPYQYNQPEYNYIDRQVNLKSPIVYYRIMAVLPGGKEKYTQTRLLRLDNLNGDVLQVTPNPFNSTFYINYRAAKDEVITIRLFNMSGQQQMVKKVSVESGANRIAITNAATLSRGVYLLQTTGENKTTRSSKILKQ